MKQVKIAPSILSKLDELKDTIEDLNKLEIDAIHMDVMDGKFVENKTFDYHLIKRIKTTKKIDTHLMIEKPLAKIKKYLKCSDIVTFHFEAVDQEELQTFLMHKPANKMIGLSIKPKTKVEDLVPYLPLIDLVLVMSVEPGKGGQAFMNEALAKLQFLRDYKLKHDLEYIIEVDGGINETTAKAAVLHGAEMLVVGTYFFQDPNYQLTIERLKA